MQIMHLHAPIDSQQLLTLRAGDRVLLSGTIYTARDAAHARFCAALDSHHRLPIDLQGQTIFYAGPTPPPPGKPTGAIGPTTSMRMDAYTPTLLRYGVNALIGKGGRSAKVREALKENGAVYFTAIGGCAAYMASCVESCEVVAYDDLGTESVKRLTVKEMPLTVALDAFGGDAYEMGRTRYLSERETLHGNEK
ncbi:MAG: FumA C-terminus/TtdB family hydratase beta subunit [Eubacteriales bacterium]|nr:FumA C-terminus/TtdB family hydratase beta subunit [Eubacteriales bacterium]